jgi:hypothetical protein
MRQQAARFATIVATAFITSAFLGCRSKDASAGTTGTSGASAPPGAAATTAGPPGSTDPIEFVTQLCAAAQKGDAAFVNAHADFPMHYHLKTEKCGGSTGKRCTNTVGTLRDVEGMSVVCKGLDGIDPAKSDAASKSKLAAGLEKRINDVRLPVTNGETATQLVIARNNGQLRLVSLDPPPERPSAQGGGYDGDHHH